MAAKRNRLTRAAALVAAMAVMGAGLSGCGGLGRALGVSKSSPDEFAVVTKAPLVLPPDYELRPPKPGAKRPQEQDPSEAARQALFKNKVVEPLPAQTGSEQPLLTSAGGGGQAPTQDNKSQLRKSEEFTNKLLFGGEAAAADEDDQPTITKTKKED